MNTTNTLAGNSKALIIPASADAITEEDIQQAYARYENAARRYLTGTDDPAEQLEALVTMFENGDEQEVAVTQQVIMMVDGVNVINECVLQLAAQRLSRYDRSFDSWGDIAGEAVRAMSTLSASGASEHRAIATVVAPFCQDHGIDAEIPPGKFGLLREAASGLSGIINNPDMDEDEKVEHVKQILEKIPVSTRAEIRNEMRKPRGVPARGMRINIDDGEAIVVLRGPRSTIAAIAQRVGNLARWSGNAHYTETVGEWRASKLGGEHVRDVTEHIEISHMEVLNGDGEIRSIS